MREQVVALCRLFPSKHYKLMGAVVTVNQTLSLFLSTFQIKSTTQSNRI